MPPPYHEKLQIGLLAGASSDSGAAAHTSALKLPSRFPVGPRITPAFTVRSRQTCCVAPPPPPTAAPLKVRRPFASSQQPTAALVELMTVALPAAATPARCAPAVHSVAVSTTAALIPEHGRASAASRSS